MDPFKAKNFCLRGLIHGVGPFALGGDDADFRLLERKCLAIYVGTQQSGGSSSNEPAHA